MRTPSKALFVSCLLLALTFTVNAKDPQSRLPVAPVARATVVDLERTFTETVRPFVENYCVRCHSGATPAAQFNLATYTTVAGVVDDYPHWSLLADKLAANQMPPAQMKQPTPEERQSVIDWVGAVLKHEAIKNAGDPGIVRARRLSNAEYNYTIRDLTGVDLRPTKEFPVDPANQAGFDNSGESLTMSPALLAKYLQAARDVANHLVLKPQGIAFASHPMLVETDRDKYAINQIIAFYQAQNTNYPAYFQAAWQYKHRAVLGKPQTTLAQVASENQVSAKYLATIWQTLEGTKEEIGPIAKLQTMWRALAAPGAKPDVDAMDNFVVSVRKKIEFKYTPIQVKGIGETAQPFLMWRNKQYASNRRSFNRAALRVEGEAPPDAKTRVLLRVPGGDFEATSNQSRIEMVDVTNDPDMMVPAGQRERYEAAFGRFAAIFPDAFYVSERGRYFPDNTRDKGRHLSAGFHNVMGYFRDDQPLYELLLDAKEQKTLDGMWDELDFVALGLTRTFIQFFLNESGEARGLRRETEGPRPADKDITSEVVVNELADAYRSKVQQANNAVALQAIDDHFAWVNARLRWVEKAKLAAEPTHLDALLDFVARAYRRPLTPGERTNLLAYYRTLRDKDTLDHEDAMRDAIVSVLMSPDFCYRLDLGSTMPSPSPAARENQTPLSDYALASRLSYFLWSSMPDAELLAHAGAGDLHRPVVLVAQARRMLKDARVRGLVTEFGANWLDFRRFEEHNAVDRERFPVFDNDLREAMFEEPVRFMLDVFRENRSVLDFIYGKHTFVNPVLAKHYGIPEIVGSADKWMRVDDATIYGRGGLLPMAVFLTKNAPGLRTSPVKRGYWVVKQVLGERIPPPPAAVPELPRDEAKMDLPLREMLARHRQDKMCASCHARFDSMGLVFEGYGPVGERRSKDLSGRVVDASATFPDGTIGDGVEGLRAYVRAHRQNDFVDNLSRKLLAYGLGRTLMLSDDSAIDVMRTKLPRDSYRFDSLIESIVTSKQFLNKRSNP